MKNLLYFILRYSTWFVFAFYVVVSCVLLFSSNPFHQSVYLTSANQVSGHISAVTTDVIGYFHLLEVNRDLEANNTRLEAEVLNLQTQLRQVQALVNDTMKPVTSTGKRFDFIPATVIGNSIRHPRNYFSIDRGERDGVHPGMGVINHNGVVGIVNVTGPTTSRVISLINVTQRFSVKLKGTPFIGSLIWKGRDPKTAYVEEVPRHAVFHIGDTVVTSGYSTTFPEGIPIGMVEGQVRSADDNFFTLKVRLFPDFTSLTGVRVLTDFRKETMDSLANFDIKE